VLLSSNLVDGNASGGITVDAGARNSVNSVPYRSISARVGTGETAVPHGLSYAPLAVTVSMTSAGTIWRSRGSDATNVYLKADAANRTADVIVG
jgi:hypothetical protein